MCRCPRKNAPPSPALLVLAVCLVLGALFAGALAVDGHGHVCSGEDCLVCISLELARNLLRGLSLAAVTALLTGPGIRAAALVKRPFPFPAWPPSLITLKVKLTS